MNKVLRALTKKSLPFALRVRCHQIVRHARWWLQPQPWAVQRGDPREFPVLMDERSSPMRRPLPDTASSAAEGKKINVTLGAAAVDGLVVAPGEIFSFSRVVGPPTRRRGFAPGLEMHDQEFTQAEGGGLCQLANLLFGLAVHVDAEIVERHRHSFDLFPDTDRTVPFGFGATVFYNYVDFQFRNSLDQPFLVRTWIDGDRLRGEVRLARCPRWRITVLESDHRFYRHNGAIWRENRLLRQKVGIDGRKEAPVFLLGNKAQVLYPAEHLLES
ncbi:MAG: VanW family protein [Chthoniobacterales bacterium]|jgi:vancomycin resistance protein VanW